ncbi:J domain-containing protein [Nitrosomonas sp. Nm34]|uniref:J domain-containing protein n=1 Tax=Nitrosomonas sp. Nm34 TaxID=1881055 RepID=UPI0008F20BDC|nr:J domain-containing protein [Nitrosomonas sp. Nm34]SFI37286.1 DnaJ domain-containing protein [Nitrosomonas sp. Nm34]
MDSSLELIALSFFVTIIGVMFIGSYLCSKAGYPFGRILTNSLLMVYYSFFALSFVFVSWSTFDLPEDMLPIIFPVTVFGLFYLLKNKYKDSQKIFFAPGSQRNEGTHTKVFQCPECAQKLRVSMPPSTAIWKCPSCNTRYKLSQDANGFLYVYLINNSDDEESELTLSISKCYTILGVRLDATPSDIRWAYKRKIKEYHPDKVSTLDVEIRDLAERKSKEIIGAYRMLKEYGLAE